MKVTTISDLDQLARRSGYKSAKEAAAARLKLPLSQVKAIPPALRVELAKWLNSRVALGAKTKRPRAAEEPSAQMRLFNPRKTAKTNPDAWTEHHDAARIVPMRGSGWRVDHHSMKSKKWQVGTVYPTAAAAMQEATSVPWWTVTGQDGKILRPATEQSPRAPRRRNAWGDGVLDDKSQWEDLQRQGFMRRVRQKPKARTVYEVTGPDGRLLATHEDKWSAEQQAQRNWKDDYPAGTKFVAKAKKVYGNPAGEGATSLSQWIRAVNLIARKRDVKRGLASYTSDPETLAAVQLIRDTPADRRSQFAKEQGDGRTKHGRLGRRSNPELIAEKADRMYEAFHGQPSEHITEIETAVHYPGDLAELGTLIELQVILDHDPEDAKVPLATLDFTGRKVSVAAAGIHTDADGTTYATELHFAGGTQELDLTALRADAQKHKPAVCIGTAHKITYATRKHFHNFSMEHYEHEFGEESGIQPSLMYDPRSSLMYLAGGNYSIRPEGITD